MPCATCEKRQMTDGITCATARKGGPSDDGDAGSIASHTRAFRIRPENCVLHRIVCAPRRDADSQGTPSATETRRSRTDGRSDRGAKNNGRPMSPGPRLAGSVVTGPVNHSWVPTGRQELPRLDCPACRSYVEAAAAGTLSGTLTTPSV